MLNIQFIGTNKKEQQEVENYLVVFFKHLKFQFIYSGNVSQFDDKSSVDVIFIDEPNYEIRCEQLRKKVDTDNIIDYVPIIILGEKSNIEQKDIDQILECADFFLKTPIDKLELYSVFKALLRLKTFKDKLGKKNNDLNRQIKEQKREFGIKERRYYRMFDETSNLIVLIDKQHKIREWNKAAEKIFEIPKEDAIGENFEKIFSNKIMRLSIKQTFLKDHDWCDKKGYRITNKSKSGKKYQILWSINELHDENEENECILAVGQDVTDRVEEERKLKQTKINLKNNVKFLNDLINALPSPIFFKDLDGKYLGCNTSYADLHGLVPKNVIGKKVNDIYSSEIAEKVNNEDDLVFKTKGNVSRELSLHIDGKLHHFILKKIYFDNYAGSNGVTGLMFDVTDLQTMKQTIKNNEEFAKGVINSANDAIIIVHTDARINFWNKAAERILGYKKEEVRNKVLCKLLGRKQEEFAGIIENLKNNDKANNYNIIEFDVNDKYGRRFPLESSLSLLELQGETFVIIVAKDVSRRKNTEKKLLEAKEKAEEADRLKSAFLSNMSHEIRTPMNAIVGFAQLLGNSSFDEQKKQVFVEQINQNSESLLKLIDDIIYVSKIESEKINIVKTTCKINKELSNMLISFLEHKRRMHKEHVELILDKSVDNEDFTIETDIQRLKQVFTNLVGNALKFTDKGSVTFGYKLTNSNSILFFVKDTGLGIRKDKVQYIFDRFTKVSATKTKLYGGTGIGLSISKNLVEKLGGKIWVESEENKGSIFYFTTPLVEGEVKEDTKEIKPIDKKEVISSKLSSLTVLVAEDEMINYLYLSELLSTKDMTIIWAKNGKEAVGHVTDNKDIDIVLMDMKMPIMDGYEATAKIKEIRADLPIIAQTAYALEDELNEVLKAGCDAYVSKPIVADDLMSAIHKYTKQS